MLVLKTVLTIISIPLVCMHCTILYLWIFDWEKLATHIGLICWVGSVILGGLVYVLYRKFVNPERFVTVIRRVVFSSSLLAVVLGVFALIIEFITRSMP